MPGLSLAVPLELIILVWADTSLRRDLFVDNLCSPWRKERRCTYIDPLLRGVDVHLVCLLSWTLSSSFVMPWYCSWKAFFWCWTELLNSNTWNLEIFRQASGYRWTLPSEDIRLNVSLQIDIHKGDTISDSNSFFISRIFSDRIDKRWSPLSTVEILYIRKTDCNHKTYCEYCLLIRHEICTKRNATEEYRMLKLSFLKSSEEKSNSVVK